MDLKQVTNRYFILRHGQSEANIEGIIISKTENGKLGYGLTPEGRRQVEENVRQAIVNELLGGPIEIHSSPFKRCKETAEVAAIALGIDWKKIIYTDLLRERNMGIFENSKFFNYRKIWNMDAQDPSHQKFDNESVSDVFQRMRAYIVRCEGKGGKPVTRILSTHADPGHIAIAGLHNIGLQHHNSRISHLQNGELRQLLPIEKSS